MEYNNLLKINDWLVEVNLALELHDILLKIRNNEIYDNNLINFDYLFDDYLRIIENKEDHEHGYKKFTYFINDDFKLNILYDKLLKFNTTDYDEIILKNNLIFKTKFTINRFRRLKNVYSELYSVNIIDLLLANKNMLKYIVKIFLSKKMPDSFKFSIISKIKTFNPDLLFLLNNPTMYEFNDSEEFNKKIVSDINELIERSKTYKIKI